MLSRDEILKAFDRINVLSPFLVEVIGGAGEKSYRSQRASG